MKLCGLVLINGVACLQSSAEFGVKSSSTKGPLWVQQTWEAAVHWLVPVSGYLGQMGVR